MYASVSGARTSGTQTEKRGAAREGHAFRYSPNDYESFANDFGFEETADQRAAIHAVIQDMISPRPMDRLVCGDVGFGKTEVALRAAFIAITGGKQVALLAPTTLLAEQHYQTLVDRFGKWPVKVAELSRFRSAKEVRSALDGIEAGTRFCEALELFSISASLGSTESLAVPPAMQQPRGMTAEQQRWTDIGPGTVRLSIGLEDIDDLRDDLGRALVAARQA